jgi:hypothetical protein
MDVDDIMKKYGRKIDSQINTNNLPSNSDFSREYKEFKSDMMPMLSRYERACKSIGNIISMKISEKDSKKVQRYLDIAHLDATPSQTMTLSLISLLVVFFTGILISMLVFLASESFPALLFFLFIIMSMFLFYYTYSLPQRLANSWRLKASSQMVPAILYVVVYMKHTSNLEMAVRFASQHLQAPLALDFRKIFWDVETGKFSTLKESLEAYLETWRDYSIEFIESFHLIESSLYETSDSRRIATLEKSLQVILDGVYEKMLSYSREIRGPLTNVYMLGIVLPTLAIALLPLASTLLSGALKWYHVFLLFNLIIPFFVFYLINQALLKRPGGYGESEILELNPLYNEYKSKKPYLIAGIICFPLIVIGFLPFIFNYYGVDFTFSQLGIGLFGDMKLFNFIISNGVISGPFGLGAVLLSLFVPLGLGLFFVISNSLKTKNLIKTREASRNLENEFVNSLFQLGNRLGGGLPAEIAFSKIAESTRGQVTEGFFRTVNINIQQSGMSLENAVFNPRRGAISYYPSSLIATSMRILVESVKKGLKVAAESLMSISEYMKNIHKINERMKDLLAEVVSDMRSNMTFLAPLLSGIVVGLGAMITFILGNLDVMFNSFGSEGAIGGIGSLSSIMAMFKIELMIPPYFLQMAIGIYIIEIVFILTGALVVIDSGEDKLKKVYDTGKNLKIAILLYTAVALIAVLVLSLLASIALPKLA